MTPEYITQEQEDFLRKQEEIYEQEKKLGKIKTVQTLEEAYKLLDIEND